MVKTRSTRDHSGEDTYDTEITTEYNDEFESSDEYDQADATVIERPNKSQSVPALSTRLKKRVSRNSTVHREAMPSSPTLHGAPDSPDKVTQNNNMGLLEGITTVMRGMMSEVIQVMRNMTETIISSIHGHPILPVKPLTRKSHRGRSSVPSRKIHKNHHFSPSDSDSSSNSTMSDKSSSDESENPGASKGKQLNSNRLPIFTGKEKWKVWFNRFEDVANLYNWSKKEKLAELLPRLQGIAGDFVYDQLSSEVTRSYRKLVKELKNRFGEIDTTKIYISKFNNRRQYNEESVQDFAAELKMLYDKGYPHRDKRTRQADLLKTFLLGLQDENVRMHVELNREPDSIEEAVYFTIHYQETCRYPDEDQYFTKGFNNRSRKPVRQIQQQNNNVPQNMDLKRCFNCDQVGHFYRQCPMPRKFRNFPNQNGGQRTNFPPPFQPRPSNSNYRPEPSFNLNAPDFTSKPDPLN
ncbi:unnamed protein product [Mytilus coruscus]|uniref:CCHC-type domain-containing protein n=1 Tax=Mytilus coruscus TaxID=42192 RepID=A0A6J8CV21_MYTCO|nr:unnamed protein product [Mytilus coruscus]